MPDGWRPWTFSRFKKHTQYRLVDDHGRTVVKASAQASASGLMHTLRLDPRRYPLLTWQWKVTELIEKADNTRKHTEDSPVRLPLEDRMFFDNIRLVTGQQLPCATLMYIWENRAAKGTVISNLHTTRIKMVATPVAGVQAFSATSTSSSIFFASPNSMRLLSL